MILTNMKRAALIMGALLICAFAGAQKRVLTLEEAVLGTGIGVQNINCTWDMGGSVYTYTLNGQEYHIDAATGKEMGKIMVKRSLFRAYSDGKNAFYSDRNGEPHQITFNETDGIVSGTSVSRNEFGIENGVFPSPDQKKIAFYQKDETRVTKFPLLDINTRTGSLREIRYPMNGMESEIIRLGVYDIETAKTIWLNVTDFTEERYLTNISWGPGSDIIYIQVLDREQENMHMNAYSAIDGSFIRTLFTDHDDRYVEPQYPVTFLPEDPTRFIYQTNVRDGFWNLYICSVNGGEPKRFTNVNADVELLDIKGNWVYYYSSEVTPMDRHLFRKDLRKPGSKPVRLTQASGWHTCQISPDGKYFIDRYSAHDVPGVTLVCTTDGKNVKEIHRAANPVADLNYCPIESGTILSADGKYENHYRMIMPMDFDPSKKYPVILYVYGGPHNKLVQNTFNYKLRTWEMYMAQRGYVVFVMDNRGTPYQGAEYEKVIHRQCGQAEMEDQMEGIKWVMSHTWVDRDRIGVHGWSYGGFMTISLMTHYPDVFKVGVAGGPVIDWKWYEVMYGERYMDTPDTNPDGFEATSLLNQAANLKGKLLICQGAIDNTVVWQHCLSFVEKCIKEGVQLDFFPYPTHEHNVSGKDRVHLMEKVTMYFDDHL